jgi:hypothetical protein
MSCKFHWNACRALPVFAKREEEVEQRKVMTMRMIAGSVFAVALAGATISAAAVSPATAQGVYIQGPGFGVGVGRPAYPDRYSYRGYRDDRGAYAYEGRRHLRGYPSRSYRWRHPDWD